MQRQLLSAAARAARAPAVRSTVQRRFASTTENAFIKEREAAKHHAAQTTGSFLRPVRVRHTSMFRVLGSQLGSIDPSSVGLWRKISIYACIPALGLAAANAYVLWNEHWDHWSHMPPLEERVEYSYQNIRTKNYQWGNGDKTIFWNDNVNYHNPDKA
ncbi:cytochrome c oxidase subunit VIa [Colletotrichum lupini]|nr:cytochrome c oxidase subunit VIa [Colletotrichum lupini]